HSLSAVSHARAHARPHPQTPGTQQLQPSGRSVSHTRVRHETSPPMKRSHSFPQTFPTPCDSFQLQSLGAPGPRSGALDWLWHGYLAGGQLTLLTSLWKSGKTTLLAVLLARLKDSGQLLGLPVRPTRALVLSEESPTLWQIRQQRLTFAEHTGLISQPFAGKPADADWRALLDHAANLLGTEGRRLLVIDTVAT